MSINDVHEQFSANLAEHAPEDFAVTVEASIVVASE